MIYQPFDKRVNEVAYHIDRLGAIGVSAYNMHTDARVWLKSNAKFSISFLCTAYFDPPIPLYHESHRNPSAFISQLRFNISRLLKEFTEQDMLSFEQLQIYRRILTAEKTHDTP